MKKCCLLMFSVLTSVSFTYAQNPIPNANFSTYWPSNPGQPNGWTDCQDISQVSPGNNVTGWAAQGYKSAGTYPAFITSSNDAGIPISTAYSYFHLFYRFNKTVTTDVMKVFVKIFNASHVQIGFGYQEITSGTSQVVFTPLHIPINYTATDAAEVIISVHINSGTGLNPNVGTSFTIDDLLLSNSATGINDIEKETDALRIYPNPANGVAHIQTGSAGKNISQLQVIDMNGRIVQQLSGAELSGSDITLPISGLPAGNYSVVVKNTETTQTKRLVIE